MKNIPVFLASDNNYAPFIASTIASVCDNTKSFVEFYIFDTDISDTNKCKIDLLKSKFNNFSIEYLKLEEDKILKHFKNKINFNYISLSTYSRFFITDFKPKLKKVLYMDVDIVVLDDIQKLYDFDLNNKTSALALDRGGNDLVEEFKSKVGLKNYFNAGVFLMDLDKWKENGYTQKAIEISQKYVEEITFQDQDILNILLKDDVEILPYKYNCQYGGEKPTLRHFVNTYKPWKTNFFKVGNKIEPLSNFEDFWKYVEMTDFYTDLQELYQTNINANMLTKRMSIIAEKMKKGEK